jgi:hypothetical protein
MAVDIVEHYRDELASHIWPFKMWPRMWGEYDAGLVFEWEYARLETSGRGSVPREPGVYSLVVQPQIGGHPLCSYLMYIGRAISLWKRFGDYLTWERETSSRPLIVKLLNKYDGYVWFCYTRLGADKLEDIEHALYTAYLPPCNRRYKGIMQKVVDAF